MPWLLSAPPFLFTLAFSRVTVPSRSHVCVCVCVFRERFSNLIKLPGVRFFPVVIVPSSPAGGFSWS